MAVMLVSPLFGMSPGVFAAGNEAVGVWARAGAWSAGHKTHGLVPSTVAAALGSVDLSEKLVEAGLWERVGTDYRFTEWHESSTPPAKRKKISRGKAMRVFERDGYACRFCRTRQNLTVDHIKPVTLGGTDDDANLQTLCMTCNLRKGAKY